MTDTLSARPERNTIGGGAHRCPSPGAPEPNSQHSQHTGEPSCQSASHPTGQPSAQPSTAAEAAAWYALHLGWPIVPGAPVLAVLGRPVPGATSLGTVDVPALVGAAALERLGKAPGGCGPIADGQGRLRFLVDLGDERPDDEHAWLEDWRAAGVDLRVGGPGAYCPLPTPGMVGRSRLVWTVPPDPASPRLPGAREITAVLDRAVRDAYPALWHVPTRGPA